jgi:hypothetical protein
MDVIGVKPIGNNRSTDHVLFQRQPQTQIRQHRNLETTKDRLCRHFLGKCPNRTPIVVKQFRAGVLTSSETE